MANNDSPYLLTKALETSLNSVLSALDIYSLQTAPQKLVNAIKRELVDARLDVRDYELSETREEQLGNAKHARTRLKKLDRDIIAASEYNIFSSVDVAQISANIEQIIERLE